MKNYYEILEVNQKASIEVIDIAYNALMEKYNNKDMQKVKEINEAYAVLSNDFLREQYNRELEKVEVNYPYRNATTRTTQSTRKKTQNNKKTVKEDSKKQEKKYNSVIEIVPDMGRDLFEKLKNIKNMQKADFLAIGLTAIIMIVIGLILWFLPFTHNWMSNFISVF